MNRNTGLAAAALVVLMALPAGAATVTYQSAEADPKVQLVIDDSPVGAFQFTLTAINGFADFLGLGFDFAGNVATAVTGAKLSLVSFTSTSATPNTPALVVYGNNTGNRTFCGTGCNFNGAGSAPNAYDYIIRIGENGGGKNNVSSVVFNVAVDGSLADNPFSNFGVRAQGTSGPNDSIKFGLVEVPPPSTVPLPAAGWLMIAGIGGLAALRRKRKAA